MSLPSPPSILSFALEAVIESSPEFATTVFTSSDVTITSSKFEDLTFSISLMVSVPISTLMSCAAVSVKSNVIPFAAVE